MLRRPAAACDVAAKKEPVEQEDESKPAASHDSKCKLCPEAEGKTTEDKIELFLNARAEQLVEQAQTCCGGTKHQ